MTVMKFGGTSVKDSASMSKVLKIVSAFNAKPLMVVLSACSGVTDNLLSLINSAPRQEISLTHKEIESIQNEHLKTINELIKNPQVREEA
ncbi:MAG: lysine-sensitive aspartokinase 3, partial [Bacteroidota bacterium]